ncbi:Cmx/CmrA family chloramphenicol efflux MFS transporter [Nocardia sp. NPDC127526]|uniref:Cmx/CmrA family chloramphenicol efflux MFS transporter n=1 Tax=Nocardia sp. NPDC127526 TaxID=3345393 RepID=UPI00363059BE
MPIVVFVLAVAVFAQGTSEFMVSGLLEQIAADVGISLGSAGLLTSLFAAGMVLGAPVMAMTAGRLPIRYSLAAFLALFCLAHVIGAVTHGFTMLLVTRVLAAISNAGFLAIALAALPRLVGPAAVGRATSVVVSGVTVACIAGVPGGTVLGQLWGWRSAFWAVAILGAAVLIPLWVLVGRAVRETDLRAERGPSILREWSVVGDRSILIAVTAGVLVNAGTFAGFTYLGSITAGVPGMGDQWVPFVLGIFGVGSFAGVLLGGRFTDHSERIIKVGTLALIGIWALAAPSAHTLPGVLTMSAVAGAAAFGVGSTLIATIVQAAAPSAPHIAGALATTAFNLGAVLGPVIAGVVVDNTGHPSAALWSSAAFTLIALAAVLLPTPVPVHSRG